MSSQPEQTPDTRSAPTRRQRRRVRVAPQTIESYIRANSAPRYMRRLRDIEVAYRAERRRLEAAYQELLEIFGDDLAEFSRRWRERARAWRFERLNELVTEHNAWYPVEANLPMDPRTRDYRLIRGASYRRLELGPAWVLEHFPSTPRPTGPDPPVHAPREPLSAPATLRRA
ncbi:MAG: hypothetical protein AVDCRST_MAG45-906 [uncultured Solirubrobacterales bacterium]|uniref:Uncharacterized protein n=1 Tax=uncultured Solirubrobacterales bacterium TaxID=768556 RepID=A0A6J4SAW6_9ACTN|nr:MAG: hypothetical protein AVDCRST_MAG45-906 [uncultured Solirubrobacterales bacterium]